LISFSYVKPHGNLIIPYCWLDTDGTADPNAKVDPRYIGVDIGITGLENGRHEKLDFWFTNNTQIPGKRTLPDSMFNVAPESGVKNNDKNPWASPGTAPIHSPCGCGGGNPDGCSKLPDEEYGSCCGQCRGGGGVDDIGGGWAYGLPLENYDFPTPKTTKWKRGEPQEIVWYLGPNHWGGYQVRLCKLPENGKEYLTEECFQKNPLDFHGKYVWVREKNEDEYTKVVAQRTRDGTYPAGSQWTKNPYIPPETREHGYIKDYVMVPFHIEVGQYVLSFRWDCEHTSQIWNMCASVDIE